MTGPITPGPRALGAAARAPNESAPPSAAEAKLHKTAQQLQALFVEQMFKAMRDTVPQDEGAVGPGQGQDMFTGLMDQHLASDTPTQWGHGLAEAAYRQLRTALPHGTTDAAAARPQGTSPTGTSPTGTSPTGTSPTGTSPNGTPAALSPKAVAPR